MNDDNFSHPAMTPFDEDDEIDIIQQFNKRKSGSRYPSQNRKNPKRSLKSGDNKKYKLVTFLENGKRKTVKIEVKPKNESSPRNVDSEDGYPTNNENHENSKIQSKNSSPFPPSSVEKELPKSSPSKISETSKAPILQSNTEEEKAIVQPIEKSTNKESIHQEHLEGEKRVNDQNNQDKRGENINIHNHENEDDEVEIILDLGNEVENPLDLSNNSKTANSVIKRLIQHEPSSPKSGESIKNVPSTSNKTSSNLNQNLNLNLIPKPIVKPPAKLTEVAKPSIRSSDPKNPTNLDLNLDPLPGSDLDLDLDLDSNSESDVTDKYELVNLIGEGSYGQVYKATDKQSEKSVACKIIDIVNSNEDLKTIQKEIAFLNKLDHPNITKFHKSFIYKETVWIIMEYLNRGSGREILDRIDNDPTRKSKGFPEKLVAIVCREMLNGLAHIHDKQMIHRDLKAANVLFTSKGDVKLADFGVSGQLDNLAKSRMTFVGTPYWMAPETIKGIGTTTAADIWSLGITAIEFAKGVPPLDHMHPMRAIFIIMGQQAPTLTGNFSKNFKKFISDCLQKDPKSRPTAKQLLTHPFIKNAGKKNLLAKEINKTLNFKSIRVKPKSGSMRSFGNDSPLTSLKGPSIATKKFGMFRKSKKPANGNINSKKAIRRETSLSDMFKNLTNDEDENVNENVDGTIDPSMSTNTMIIKKPGKSAQMSEQSKNFHSSYEHIDLEPANEPTSESESKSKSNQTSQSDQPSQSENKNQGPKLKLKPKRKLNIGPIGSSSVLKTNSASQLKKSSNPPVLKLKLNKFFGRQIKPSNSPAESKNKSANDYKVIKYENTTDRLYFLINSDNHRTVDFPWNFEFNDDLKMNRFEDF